MLKTKETNISSKTSNPKPVLNLNLRAFVLPGLFLLLFYPPLLRGIFFAPELLMTHMYTGILFALCWYDKALRKDVAFLKGSFDYSTLAFVIVYVFSLFGAVNMRGAVGELLKVINYFMVYWITAQMVKNEKDLKNIYRAIYFSAVGVAVVGLGVVAGSVEYPGAIWTNRLSSTLQYPNTTATFMSLATFLGLGLINVSRSRLGKFFYMLGNMLMIAVIIAAQSRGTWFLYPIIVTGFIWGLPKSFRFATLYNLVISMGVGLQLARVLQKAILVKDTPLLRYVLLGAVFVAAAQWAYDFVLEWLDRREVRAATRRMIGIGVVVYALAVLGVYVIYTTQAVPTVAAKFAPTSALERAGAISNQENSFQLRLDYTKAAIKIGLDYPVNGLGGEGWNALYHRYLPVLNYTSETHNYPAKVLVETGFIGLLALFAIWYGYIKNVYRLWKLDPGEEAWALIWAGTAAVAALVLHSIFDFDLTMGAMGIILWGLWGLFGGMEKIYFGKEEIPAGYKKNSTIAFVAGTIGAAILFLPAASLYAAGSAAMEGARLMTQSNWAGAEARLNKAVKLDPFSAAYAADLAQVYYIKGVLSKDETQMALGDKFVRAATDKEPYNYQVRLRMMMDSVITGRVEHAVYDAESLVAYNPLDIHNYEIMGKIYVIAGRYLYDNGQKEKAREYWLKADGLGRQLEQKINELDEKPKYWSGAPLQITSVINIYQGEAAYLLGNHEKSLSLLKKAISGDKTLPKVLRAEVMLYLNAVKAKEGNLKEAQQEIARLADSSPGIKTEFKKLLKY